MRRAIKAATDVLLPVLITGAIWEALSRAGILNPVLVPPPSRILGTLVALMKPGGAAGGSNGILLTDLVVSILRLVAAMGISAVIGIPLGILMATNRWVEWFFRPVIALLMPIPALAWTPLLMVMLGLGSRTTITVAFLAAVIPITYTSFAGVRSISRNHVWAAQMMGASSFGLLKWVFFPGALEQIIPGLRLAFARAWRSVIAGEMLAATNLGLGYLIVESGQYMDTETIYAAILVISMTGLIVEHGLFDWVERRTVRQWGLVQ